MRILQHLPTIRSTYPVSETSLKIFLHFFALLWLFRIPIINSYDYKCGSETLLLALISGGFREIYFSFQLIVLPFPLHLLLLLSNVVFKIFVQWLLPALALVPVLVVLDVFVLNVGI
jgi:hypothetical protein